LQNMRGRILDSHFSSYFYGGELNLYQKERNNYVYQE